MLASIVIPAYNAGPHFEECLGSIFAQTCRDFEVIWVDSASTDGSLQRVREQFPQVSVRALRHNAGYRQGTNLGAELARGKYVVICNQDVRVEPTWLAEMIACAEANPEIGIVAPKILLYDQPGLTNEAGNTLQYCGLLTSRGLGEPAAAFDRPETLATMSGCCFLIRRDLWTRLQGFSSDFDAYNTGLHAGFEDVDLAWRAQLQGFLVVLCPPAVMYHKFERKDANLRFFHVYEWNRYMIVLRNYRLRSLVALAPLLVGLEAAACLFAALRGPRSLLQNLGVLPWFAMNGRLVKRMRDRIQATRIVNDRAIVERMNPSVSFVRAIGARPPTRVLQKIVDGVLTAYHRMLLTCLRVVEPSAAKRRLVHGSTGERFLRIDAGRKPWPGSLPRHRRSLQQAIKRVIDVSVSATLLLASLPLLAVVWLAVRWTTGRPVLFRQQRPGWHGEAFMLYKFRTMTDARGADGQLLDDGQRLTGLGQFLRRTSLDELPQLWNVLRGDLSLVGPRPLLMEYLERYSPEQARRHEVKPGITGWAQINGRNAIAWEEKFRLDVWYVDHWTLRLDLYILLLTAWKVLRREGIKAGSHATMPAFLGSQRTPSTAQRKRVVNDVETIWQRM